jgi:phenylalanyl-tRNA synthetase alpha chain
MLFRPQNIILKLRSVSVINPRSFSVKPVQNVIEINNNKYAADDYTNVSSKILSYMGRNLHLQKDHPLSMIRQRLVNHFYREYTSPKGTPQFSVYDRISPIVTVGQNFDSLLIPEDHVSRSKSDCYYINREYLLRAHCTAHQVIITQNPGYHNLTFPPLYFRWI